MPVKTCKSPPSSSLKAKHKVSRFLEAHSFLFPLHVDGSKQTKSVQVQNGKKVCAKLPERNPSVLPGIYTASCAAIYQAQYTGFLTMATCVSCSPHAQTAVANKQATVPK